MDYLVIKEYNTQGCKDSLGINTLVLQCEDLTLNPSTHEESIEWLHVYSPNLGRWRQILRACHPA